MYILAEFIICIPRTTITLGDNKIYYDLRLICRLKLH